MTKLKNLPAERRAQIAEEILDSYRDGKEISALAPSYGVNPSRIYELLLSTSEETWKAARAARTLERLEAARNDLSKALDPIAVNRADKLVHSLQWELERVSRAYGRSSQEEGSAVQIRIGIVRRAPVTIEQEK